MSNLDFYDSHDYQPSPLGGYDSFGDIIFDERQEDEEEEQDDNVSRMSQRFQCSYLEQVAGV